MNILMLGWEFPPYKTGGLGTACYGLTKGMSKEGVDITFVVPF
ncbi:MAG: glycogen/starch synthase, partial [Candidatus Woesearchaeota archaeon]|nr:glycogen/starch synthase [Candidatus Woesearchaeota archaeon]MDP7646997.1 glycogen/starch synthase [Candidatus Woesearchaeota archaeon]